MNVSDEKQFRFRTFRVLVPQTLFKRWAAISTREKGRIIDSVRAVYAAANEEWKRAKFKPTREGIRTALELTPSIGETLTKTVEKLTNPELEKRVLWLLQFARYRAWNRSPIARFFQRAVTTAAADGDQSFFKALGERLKKKPILFKPPGEPTALKRLLLENWITSRGICFCWFSDKALTDFLKQTHESYTPDAVRKTRERLRLRKLRHPIVRSVEKVDNRIHLQG